MSQDRRQITQREVTFAPDEFIVSKTDAKGIITYANDVFCRVAGYTQEEVLGKPHNYIRHPWMPRCVFKLLWERIKAGHEIFAYVVNRTKQGDHYWVFAHVTPSMDGNGKLLGYHSNRRLPEPEAVRKVSALYQTLRKLEDDASTPKEGVEASMQALTNWVNSNGGNYDALVHTL